MCRQCRVWALCPDDNVCSWCGTNFLRFNVTLEQNTFMNKDYPPPAVLAVRNESSTQTIFVERVKADVPWIELLPSNRLHVAIKPSEEHHFLLDVDTFAANPKQIANVEVAVLNGHTKNVIVSVTDAGVTV